MDNAPYLTFFSLREVPFSITPDPEFLFLSKTHRIAIDTLCHGIKSRAGFLLLTGEIGAGKTMVCRIMLKKQAQSANLVYIINPSLTGTELIGAILDDLDIPYPENASKKTLLYALNSFLLDKSDDKPVVILIDDAQTMSVESLEDIRLLSNLETNKEKLLQIVLVGQPELLELISTKALRQLQQRITIHSHLDFLSLQETRLYILRRLFVAGDHGNTRFTSSAVRLVHRESRGLPRSINKICDYAMMAGFVDDANAIKRKHVKKACQELRHLLYPEQDARVPSRKPVNRLMVACLLLLLAIAGAWKLYSDRHYDNEPTAPIATSSSPVESATPLPPVKPEVIAEQPTINQPPSVPEPPVVTIPAKETPSLDQEKTAPPQESKTPELPVASTSLTEASPAFTLQLASFSSENDAIKEIEHYAAMGITAHVQKKGEWHRLLAGVFSSRNEAMAVKKKLGLNQAVLHFTPDARHASSDDFLSLKVKKDEPPS